MQIAQSKSLFAWDCLEDSPSLRTIKAILESLPDSQLLLGLRDARGRGRNDYPVRGLWGVVVLTVALRHTGFEACLGELRRNEALRRLIGIESEAKVPKKWNVSRFLEVLGDEPHFTRLEPADGVAPDGLQRLPSLPRATKKFARLYDGRTSVERVNARLKVFWGVDDGNISGARRFRASVGVVMAVHACFATLFAKAPRTGTLGKLPKDCGPRRAPGVPPLTRPR